MKILFKYLGHILIFIFLTLLTQVGGIVYLICLPIFKYFKPRINRPIWHILLNISVFCALYTFTTFIIVPPLAENYGRVQMPYDEENAHLRQWNRWTVILNRNYVVPELRTVTEGVAPLRRIGSTAGCACKYSAPRRKVIGSTTGAWT